MSGLKSQPQETKLQIGDLFLLLEYEANQNGNTNWCFFPESCEHFRGMAKAISDEVRPQLNPQSAGDDDDEACCLLIYMIEDNPHDLPCAADYQYAALKRCLIRLGYLLP